MLLSVNLTDSEFSICFGSFVQLGVEYNIRRKSICGVSFLFAEIDNFFFTQMSLEVLRFCPFLGLKSFSNSQPNIDLFPNMSKMMT